MNPVLDKTRQVLYINLTLVSNVLVKWPQLDFKQSMTGMHCTVGQIYLIDLKYPSIGRI